MTNTIGIRARIALAFALLVTLAGCGGGGSDDIRRGGPPPTPPPSGGTVAPTHAYSAGSPYADVLRDCTYAGEATQRCTLATLPFLGMDTADPTIADVMARTLVSHDWMGANLAAVLERVPADLLPLFRSVTAVVIASDIRPAHYDPDTGAIYLDPDFLWLSVAERDTVSTAPDPRSSFGLDLQFRMPWRYVRNNERMTVFLNPDGSRDLSQIEEIMAYLLYHELAHAVDFMPPDRMSSLAADLTVPAAFRQQPRLSTGFQTEWPLQSNLLKQLAAVSFLGEDATAEQLALQPADLVTEFANDGAVQYYAYTTQFEDFAVLFETAMMKWHYGYDKDTGIIERPGAGGTDASAVVWGSRGRLGEPPVYHRVLAVAQRIYPGDMNAFQAFLDGQPSTPLRMREGDSWGANLVLDAAAATSQARRAASTESALSVRRPDYFLERVRIR